jgi:hypothetical protein
VRPPSKREEIYAELAGWLLMRVGLMAHVRGDKHRFEHIRAALNIGNMGPGSHDDGCRLQPRKVIIETRRVRRG